VGEIEQHLIDCADIARDMNKSSKSRSIARTSIKICHGVIDLKDENRRLTDQVTELRKRLKDGKIHETSADD